MRFSDNTIVKANMGIYILSLKDKYSRENFQIRDNAFERIRRAALVAENPISGGSAETFCAILLAPPWLKEMTGSSAASAGTSQATPQSMPARRNPCGLGNLAD